ncbi:UDP-3-O-(3-hydroxymyristoyl)glucosamine N-acyltransferase [Methylocapsa palsarum]|uniref:UDP-3-O-[3-hydroxymyristoyl] glucosamine N-acyltransferase n=1 Tax=Methylocapsa palsarum TaxID=1612308 RepID=A0A1I3WF26_9HYPH|nr:UDP-3-O-(3-hydroxymyristoyl)glucosamine N-acyltransferase [Methylocapsa palsarum]SFK05407.1 UDP-3-O-[3-hydroxymyristoyl] glucosamine N-acyltransferase [Methylocapsa palsarum]
MSDPFFFARAPGLTLGDIVAVTGVRAGGGVDLSLLIGGAAPFDEAVAGELTYFDDLEHIPIGLNPSESAPGSSEGIEATRASACFVEPCYEALVAGFTLALVTEEPHRAFAAALAQIFPEALRPASIFTAAGLNPGASVHPEARLEPGVVVDPGAVIGARCEIGSGSMIAANSVIGSGVRIGRNCSIGAQAAITHALIGDRVIIHEGAKIGQAGLDFRDCGEIRRFSSPQVGRVILQDGVEVGANSTIDRGSSQDTVIGEGARIGNLVQISPGVTVGRGCMILCQTSIAAETRLGDFVVVEGGARVGRRLRIGRGERVRP